MAVSTFVVRDTLDDHSVRRGLDVSIGHAVSVLFDVRSADRILAASDSVGEGVGLRELGAQPHISLGVFRSAVDVDILAPCVAALAAETQRFELRLSAVGSFPSDEGVIFLAPTPTAQLLDVHRRFHQMLVDHDISSDPLYRPDQWVPHCTVGQAVPEDRLPFAIAQLRRADVFGPVAVVSVNLTEFLPVRELVAHRVAGGLDANST
jgi:2'-5' RNA ligase